MNSKCQRGEEFACSSEWNLGANIPVGLPNEFHVTQDHVTLYRYGYFLPKKFQESLWKSTRCSINKFSDYNAIFLTLTKFELLSMKALH